MPPTRRPLFLALALLAAVAVLVPAASAAPPGGAPAENGLQEALEHVPSFVGDLLGEIASWFSVDASARAPVSPYR